MIDSLTYRAMHPGANSNVLIDELGPEAMACDKPPSQEFLLLLPNIATGFDMSEKKWSETYSISNR